jgi:hypothetical protein
MRSAIVLLISSLISCYSYGQIKAITGRVIDEFELSPIPGVKILGGDSVVLATTDLQGNFEAKIQPGDDKLRFLFIGMEGTSIKIPASCNKLEIIMMTDVTYDYITIKKINRKRCKRFKELPTKHNEAFRKGIFTSTSHCFEYIYENY